MAETPIREFGKRRPVAIPAAAPVKRSGHVALLLMGTFAVGGGAYALMPGENCGPTPAGMAAPALPQTNTRCASGGSSHAGLGRLFYGSDTSRSSSAASSDSASSGVTRGGFGSFARAFGFSGRG